MSQPHEAIVHVEGWPNDSRAVVTWPVPLPPRLQGLSFGLLHGTDQLSGKRMTLCLSRNEMLAISDALRRAALS